MSINGSGVKRRFKFFYLAFLKAFEVFVQPDVGFLPIGRKMLNLVIVLPVTALKIIESSVKFLFSI
jgi:hypothetical protein